MREHQPCARPLGKVRPLSRRTLLQGAGACVALPFLEAMLPTSAWSAGTTPSVPPRMAIFYFGIGMNVNEFFPKETGKTCELPSILKPLEAHREKMTVLSGTFLEHGGGHQGDYTFTTGAPGYTRSGIENSISADQVAANHLGQQTRFPSLQFSIQRGTGYGSQGIRTLSWNAKGIPLAAENDPSLIFARLFKVDSPRESAAQKENFRKHASVLDYVNDRAKHLRSRVGKADREKLDEYFSSVRSIEQQLQRQVDWSKKPKPKPALGGLGDYGSSRQPSSRNFDYAEYAKLMYDLIALAFQTDSTRVLTYVVRSEGGEIFDVHNVSKNYHALTHHNNDPKNLRELAQVDEINMRFWADFLKRLDSIQEADGSSLLDHTMLAYSSGMGIDHSRDRLPTALFGGSALGIRHQTHAKLTDKTPLASVWHTMLDRMNVPVGRRFQDSAGVLEGLLS